MSSERHRIFVCTSCRHRGSECRPGFDLICKLQQALNRAAPVTGDDFVISGTACMAGCSRPCTIAFKVSAKATYLFGDIDPETDIDDLVAFAQLYRDLEDGWCASGQRPGKLRGSALARIPAAMIVTGVGGKALS